MYRSDSQADASEPEFSFSSHQTDVIPFYVIQRSSLRAGPLGSPLECRKKLVVSMQSLRAPLIECVDSFVSLQCFNAQLFVASMLQCTAFRSLVYHNIAHALSIQADNQGDCQVHVRSKEHG